LLAGRSIPAVAFGAMPLSTAGRPDREQALATIGLALDAGVGLLDTADAYCLNTADTGHNERLLAEALARRGHADDVLVATKGGSVRGSDGSWAQDGRPEHLQAACRASARALQVEVIDLYQFHRPDPNVPFAESVGAVAELQQAGLVRHVGVSNVDVDEIRVAQDILPLASVQNELSPDFRSSLDEVAYCAAQGIAFLAWGPLGGAGGAATLGQRHPAFAAVAARHGVSAQQVAVAWVLAQAPVVVALVGARRPQTFLDSWAAAELQLTDDDLRELDAVA
jgi:aryl-alcohol dehydrogenase-like predicted oxidoreductase